MSKPSTKTLEVSEVVELLFAYIKSLGKKVPEKWDPSMNPFKDLGLKSRDGADLAEEFGKLVGHDLPEDCTPLVKKNAEGKKRARTLAEITEFLNTQMN
jgi:hypothetical protein